jgi:regulator of replication initiation timing
MRVGSNRGRACVSDRKVPSFLKSADCRAGQNPQVESYLNLRDPPMAWPKAFDLVSPIKELKDKIESLQKQRRSTGDENERVRKEIERLQRRENGLEQDKRRMKKQLEREQKERARLRGENEKLKQQLEQAQPANKRQAAFSRGQRKRNPKRPGRKPGEAYVKHYRKGIPEQVDEVIAVPAPAQCPMVPRAPTRACGTAAENLNAKLRGHYQNYGRSTNFQLGSYAAS